MLTRLTDALAQANDALPIVTRGFCECCPGRTWEDLRREHAAGGYRSKRGAIFFTRQDAKNPEHGVHLSFGSFDLNASTAVSLMWQFVDVLLAHGLYSLWDGTESSRPIVLPPPRGLQGNEYLAACELRPGDRFVIDGRSCFCRRVQRNNPHVAVVADGGETILFGLWDPVFLL